MKIISVTKIFLLTMIVLNLNFILSCKSKDDKTMPDMTVKPKTFSGVTQTAVFAGGCFWGVEGVFEEMEGVVDAVSGYAGGNADTAHYHMVGTGTTGHAESVKVVFDPKTISYETLLKVFFLVAHNPTELNYQGPDKGSQYRSAIFYIDESQKNSAEKYIKELETKKVYKEKIVTEISPLKEFYPAEDYHQDFMRLNPDYPYIVYWDKPKIDLLKKKFPELISSDMK